VNLVYYRITHTMTKAEKTNFDIQIAPTELREITIDRQNAEQMKLLQGGAGPKAKPVPLPHRRRKRDE